MVAGGGLFRYGRAMAWPERVLLIVVVGFAVVAGELVALLMLKRAPPLLGLACILTFLLLDIWLSLRAAFWFRARP